MKYPAILKDSVREALDSKVLYVMVGLSTLVILFVATMSFEPLSAELTMKQIVGGTAHFTLLANRPEEFKQAEERDVGKNQPFAAMGDLLRDFPQFNYQKVTLLRGEPDSPNSDYALLLSQNFVTKERADKMRATPVPLLAEAKKLFAPLEELDLIKVGDIRLPTDEPEWTEGLEKTPGRVFVEVKLLATPGTRRLWATLTSLFFGSVPLGDRNSPFNFPLGFQLYTLSSLVLGFGSWIAVLAGVIITAFFIPNMLRKGTIDLLLVKPIHRWGLLLYKYLGGLTFVFLNITYAIVGIWLVLGLKTGIWANSFLLIIFVYTFFFAILYAVSTLIAVLTRSIIASILVTCGAWFFFFLVGFIFSIMDQTSRQQAAQKAAFEDRASQGTFGQIVKVVHIILPRTEDLNYLSKMLLYSDFLTGSLAKTSEQDTSAFNWGESLVVSGGFIALMLALACWRFSVRDY